MNFKIQIAGAKRSIHSSGFPTYLTCLTENNHGPMVKPSIFRKKQKETLVLSLTDIPSYSQADIRARRGAASTGYPLGRKCHPGLLPLPEVMSLWSSGPEWEIINPRDLGTSVCRSGAQVGVKAVQTVGKVQQ